MMQPLLKIDRLSCERNGILLFEDLSFDIFAGQIVHVAGSNGSGKTTLLRLIAGIGFADNHCIKMDDVSILYIGHKLGIKGLLSPLENLGWYYPDDTNSSIMEALDYWGLSGYEERLCGRLSAGQQQRVALSRLLLSKDLIWILDEPFTSLDVAGFQKLESLLKNHLEKNGAVILTAHHLFNVGAQSQKINLGGGND